MPPRIWLQCGDRLRTQPRGNSESASLTSPRDQQGPLLCKPHVQQPDLGLLLRPADHETHSPRTAEACCANFPNRRGTELREASPKESHLKGPACEASRCRQAPEPPTSTALLVRPVPTVILSVAFPLAGHTVAILTLELEVAGAVWSFCGVFWGMEHTVSHLPCTSVNVKLSYACSPLHPHPRTAYRSPPNGLKGDPVSDQESVHTLNQSPSIQTQTRYLSF